MRDSSMKITARRNARSVFIVQKNNPARGRCRRVERGASKRYVSKNRSLVKAEPKARQCRSTAATSLPSRCARKRSDEAVRRVRFQMSIEVFRVQFCRVRSRSSCPAGCRWQAARPEPAGRVQGWGEFAFWGGNRGGRYRRRKSHDRFSTSPFH